MPDHFKGSKWDKGKDLSSHQTEFATKRRIPFLRDAWPTTMYITGIVIGDGYAWQMTFPTEDEVTLVAQYLEEFRDRYPLSFQEEMKQFAPYDIDGGGSQIYFRKHPKGGWGYHRGTWRGQVWAPEQNESLQTLEEVFDRSRRS
jgi:hypothetical protein